MHAWLEDLYILSFNKVEQFVMKKALFRFDAPSLFQLNKNIISEIMYLLSK